LLALSSGIIGGTRSGSIDPTLIFHHTPECSANVDENGQGLITKAELVLNKCAGSYLALPEPSDHR
jgi:acetate kinase